MLNISAQINARFFLLFAFTYLPDLLLKCKISFPFNCFVLKTEKTSLIALNVENWSS